MKEDWTQKEGWLQQDNLIYVGLIGIGVVIILYATYYKRLEHDAGIKSH